MSKDHNIGNPPPIREFDEINKEYNQVCTILGDLEVKASDLKLAKENILLKVAALKKESKDASEREAKRKERQAKLMAVSEDPTAEPRVDLTPEGTQDAKN